MNKQIQKQKKIIKTLSNRKNNRALNLELVKKTKEHLASSHEGPHAAGTSH
jgi:hypothetical protein